jgi:UPF0042 nucleotide-binding protein
VDNLPVVLLPEFMDLNQAPGTANSNLAVVVDVRNQEFLSEYRNILQKVRDAGHKVEVYFFDAADEVLMRRYSETRRRHPLMQKEGLSVSISRERQLLAEVIELATVVIDSSGLTPHQLRAKVVQIARGSGGGMPLAVLLQSFGYRYGLPVGSDLVMDVRFLPNPHFIPELRPQTGLSMAVREYVLSQSATLDFLNRFLDLLRFLLPAYRQEGKSYLTISIGCTGGHHRSVAIVERLRRELDEPSMTLEVMHRDIAKG